MPRYHVNPETQRPNICRATEKRGCLYAESDGSEPPHFPTKDAARAWVEEESAREAGGSFAQSITKKKGAYKSDANSIPEHEPQQKIPQFTEEYLRKLALSESYPDVEWPERTPAPKGMSLIQGQPVSMEKVEDLMEEHNNTAGSTLYKPGSLRVTHRYSGLSIVYTDAKSGDNMIYRVDGKGKAILRKDPEQEHQELVDYVISEKFPREENPTTSLEQRAVDHVAKLAKVIEERSPDDWENDVYAVSVSYTEGKYKEINQAVREGTASEALLNSLDTFSKEHVLKEDTIVYRGVHALGEDDVRASLDANRRGLLSTSTRAGTALNFSGGEEGSTVMRIVLPKGTQCRIVGGHESEIILPRDAELKDVEILRLTKSMNLWQ